ncbi:unnamed protein product, partial [Polarella glacialis]
LGSVGERILASATPEHREWAHVPVHIKGDASILYKYINPNMLTVVSEDDKGNLNLYALDAVTGHVLHQSLIPGGAGPVHVVACDNWIVLHYRNAKRTRFEILVTEFFQAKADEGPWDILFPGKKANRTKSAHHLEMPVPLQQSYVFPAGVTSMGVTATLKGITPRSIIMGLSTDKIFRVSKDILNPRRPYSEKLVPGEKKQLPSQFAPTKDEPLFPYVPVLPVRPEEVMNYYNALGKVKGIASSPTALAGVVAEIGGTRPAGKASRQGQQARPAGKASRQGQQARPAGKASKQGQQARPAGKASSQSQQARPAGKASRQGQQARSAGKASRQGQQARPAGKASRQGQQARPAGRPAGKASRQGQQARPAGKASRQGQQARPAGKASRQGQQATPAGKASRQGQQARPAGKASRQGQQARPAGKASRQGQQARPAGKASRQGQQGRPAGKASRQGQQARPAGKASRQGQQARPAGKASRQGQGQQARPAGKAYASRQLISGIMEEPHDASFADLQKHVSKVVKKVLKEELDEVKVTLDQLQEKHADWLRSVSISEDIGRMSPLADPSQLRSVIAQARLKPMKPKTSKEGSASSSLMVIPVLSNHSIRAPPVGIIGDAESPAHSLDNAVSIIGASSLPAPAHPLGEAVRILGDAESVSDGNLKPPCSPFSASCAPSLDAWLQLVLFLVCLLFILLVFEVVLSILSLF